MKNKWILVTGIILGLISVVLVQLYLSRSQQAFTLLQFKRALKKGDEIPRDPRETLAAIAVPEHFSSVLREAVLAEDQAWVVGKALVHDVAAGDFLLYSHLAASPEEDFDRKLDKDKRALALQVTNETGVGGFIEPGSFVDIVATVQEPKDAQNPAPRITTKTILQKVKVLAVGNRALRTRTGGAERDRGGSTTVTLELTPLQVEKVIFTQQHSQGPLTLALAHPESPTETALPSISWENFDQIR